jgi:hypothetical protein
MTITPCDSLSQQQSLQQPSNEGTPDPVSLIASETPPPPPLQDEPGPDTAHLIPIDAPQTHPPTPDESKETSGIISSPAALAVFIFPDGYASREFTRDSLSQLEQRYFDHLDESRDAATAQVVLDRFDLCHQAGFDSYDDAVAFVEGRVTLEELARDREELAEIRQQQCERQKLLDERMEANRATLLALLCA